MDESARNELEALRRRAYGRGADSTLDAQAQERLRDLEGQAAGSASSKPVRHRPPGGESTSVCISDAASHDSALTSRTLAGRIGVRVIVWWVASIVVTAVAVSAVPWWVAREPGREVAVLGLSESDRWAETGFADAVATEDFFGLTLIRSSVEDSDFCLAVIPTTQEDQGLVFSGCSAGVFPATVQMTVTSASPPALINEFREGSALWFALDGDAVRVRTDAP